jgi:thiol-disulfide isomerase/thioredoxin
MRNFSAEFDRRPSIRWEAALIALFWVAAVSTGQSAIAQSPAQTPAQTPVVSAINDTHLYFFTSQGCAPCEMVKPSLKQLAAAGYPVTTVDIRQRPDWATHFRVDRTPTVIMVRNQQIVGRHAGVIGHSELVQWFAASGFTPPRSPNANYKNAPDVAVEITQPSTSIHFSSDTQPSSSASSNALASADFNNPGRSDADFQSPTMHTGTPTPANNYERQAMDATVKIKVEDPEGISYATGTVVHSHGSECLVVTCGHVFRDSKGTGEITGLYGFAKDQSKIADGELIFFDADARDIALLVLKTEGDSIPAVEIASRDANVRIGQTAFSIGCDHGENPTIRHTKIKNRAAYDGAIKYDIYGRPVDGRSGGGLFSADGKLIGVCNAAVVDVDEGIYTALDTIHWQLQHTNLAHLFEPSASQDFAERSNEAPAEVASRDRPKVAFPRSTPRPAGRSSLVALRGPDHWLAKGSGLPPSSIASNREVLIIVRSKDDSRAAQTITLPNPSHRLIDYLQNMPPVKSEVRQIDVANFRDAAKFNDPLKDNDSIDGRGSAPLEPSKSAARIASEQFRQRIQRSDR